MKDNNNQLENILIGSFKYPNELTGAEMRFEKRLLKEKRKKKALACSVSAIAVSLLFVIMINTNVAFANAIAELPVIGQLAEYVKFDKSLSKAIENKYLQEVNLVSWDNKNNIRLLLPYVIADEKKLILFFQLPEEFEQQPNQWINIFLKEMKNSVTGEKVDGYGYSSSSLSKENRDENFGFIKQDYHFEEGKLPKSLDIDVELKVENISGPNEAITADSPYNHESYSSFETLGNYSFHIELEDFISPVIYEINENHTIYGQKVIVESMKVYPTGTEVNFSFPNENTAYIKGLELELVQDGDKERILKVNSNGFSASYNSDNTTMSVFIESNYFDKPKKQELFIKALRLLDKDKEFITVDIDNKIITPYVEGLELEKVIRQSDDATLIFSTHIYNNDNFGLFNHDYRDIEGNVYSFNSEGTSSRESQMQTIITVKYPQSGKVILQRLLTPKIILEKPIRINLPAND